MTKREICKRLLEIRDYVKETDTWQFNNNTEQGKLTLHNVVAVVASDLRDLILDITASEENHGPVILCNEDRRDFFTDTGTPKREEKPKVETPYKCPTCGFSPISKVGRDIWCPKCEIAYECEQHTETENDKL